ncbi:MAG: hypothetical protein ACI8P9_002034 [Parasphingorhabdus sp.]
MQGRSTTGTANTVSISGLKKRTMAGAHQILYATIKEQSGFPVKLEPHMHTTTSRSAGYIFSKYSENFQTLVGFRIECNIQPFWGRGHSMSVAQEKAASHAINLRNTFIFHLFMAWVPDCNKLPICSGCGALTSIRRPLLG